MWGLVARLLREITVSVIAQKSLKAFGKNDYADVVRLAGWAVYGITIMELINISITFIQNSKIFKFFEWLF